MSSPFTTNCRHHGHGGVGWQGDGREGGQILRNFSLSSFLPLHSLFGCFCSWQYNLLKTGGLLWGRLWKANGSILESCLQLQARPPIASNSDYQGNAAYFLTSWDEYIIWWSAHIYQASNMYVWICGISLGSNTLNANLYNRRKWSLASNKSGFNWTLSKYQLDPLNRAQTDTLWHFCLYKKVPQTILASANTPQTGIFIWMCMPALKRPLPIWIQIS